MDDIAHQFLRFSPQAPGQRLVRDLACELMVRYASERLSYKQWHKQKPRMTKCFEAEPDGKIKQEWWSKPFTIMAFERELDRGEFDFAKFDLYDPRCNWLDSSVHISINFHLSGTDGSVSIAIPTTLGSKFPIVPKLDREGSAFNSFQVNLQDRILKVHKSLVDGSAQFSSWDWFMDLRSYITECVALVDITLHQLYAKAQYDPRPGWIFDKERLGSRYGRRLSDKLKWVFQITRQELNAPDEIASLMLIKTLRNHLQHFDPPCFCFTLEDVADWLGRMGHIARLVWKMRQCMGSPPSVSLMKMLLGPKVIFVPNSTTVRRWPQSSNVGYASTRDPLATD